MVPIPSIVINALIAPVAVAAWLSILLGVTDSGSLADTGVKSLRYFTVLSNLFSAVVSLVYLAVCLATGAEPALWLIALKLVAAASVMLTCVTVMTILVPLYGLPDLLKGGNLWLHLILPVLAAVDCCVFVGVGQLPFTATLFAMLPTAAYGAFYLHEVIVHGPEEDGFVYDCYGFLRWGWKGVPVAFAAMLLVTWAIAVALWFLG